MSGPVVSTTEESAARWCEELSPRFTESGAPATCRKIAEGGDGYVFELGRGDDRAAERPSVLLKVMLRRLNLLPSAHNPPVAELACFVLSAMVRHFVAKCIHSRGFIAGVAAGHRVSPGCGADGGGGGGGGSGGHASPCGGGGGSGGVGIAVDVALSMEHVRGSSLEKRCSRYRRAASTRAFRDQVREWTGIIAAVEQLAATLHARGVVHRDLKCANIMYHPGREDAVAFVDFDTATFEGPTLERAGEAPGTPFWASPLQMAPPEASVPGGGAAWATAEHDRYSCALMGLKMWCDAAGTAYLPYAHFATLHFPPAVYTQLQQRAGAAPFQFEEGLRRLLHRLFELFGVEGLEVLHFSRELGGAGQGETHPVWDELVAETTWASKRAMVRRPRWRVDRVLGYPAIGLLGSDGDSGDNCGGVAAAAVDTISGEEAIQRLRELRGAHCGSYGGADVEHAPPNELLCCDRTTFHAMAFQRLPRGDAASTGGGGDDGGGFDFGRTVAAILRMHATVMDTVARFVHVWADDTALDGGASPSSGHAGVDGGMEPHEGALGCIPTALGLVPSNTPVVRMQAASWIMREIDQSGSRSGGVEGGGGTGGGGRGKSESEGGASSATAGADSASDTVLELEALANACINHCLGPLPPPVQVERSASVLIRLRPKMRTNLLAISDLARGCPRTLAQLCAGSSAAATAEAKAALEHLDGALQYLTIATLRPGAETATAHVIVEALKHMYTSLETVLSSKTAPAAAPLHVPFKHVVASIDDGARCGASQQSQRAREQAWAMDVAIGLRAADFNFTFM